MTFKAWSFSKNLLDPGGTFRTAVSAPKTMAKDAVRLLFPTAKIVVPSLDLDSLTKQELESSSYSLYWRMCPTNVYAEEGLQPYHAVTQQLLMNNGPYSPLPSTRYSSTSSVCWEVARHTHILIPHNFPLLHLLGAGFKNCLWCPDYRSTYPVKV